jgi:hypothetical protein
MSDTNNRRTDRYDGIGCVHTRMTTADLKFIQNSVIHKTIGTALNDTFSEVRHGCI